MKVCLTLGALFLPGLLAAQGPTAGQPAPAWTLQVASQEGVAADSLSLASLRGKTVVMAFFPKARTRGCTVQMRAYRDRYAELFGSDVELIAISRDSAAVLAAWAAEEKFPFRFASDVEGTAGRAYGTLVDGNQWESRVLFVIEPTGTVSAVMRPFREIDPTAYDELRAAVQAARGATR